MNWALRRTEKAIDDLVAIFDYIAIDNPVAAEKLVENLLSLFERVRDFPYIGRPAHEIAPGHHILTYGRYLLIYCIYDDQHLVELVRVIHGSRDWPALFDA